MEQVLVFANPISGRGRGRILAGQVERALREAGYAVRTFFTRADSVEYGGSMRDVRAAVVIGGDGTLRGVAQWAIDRTIREGCAGERCLPYPVLIVPTGTANLMGKHLGIHWSERGVGREVLEAIQHGRVVGRDVARMGDGVFLLMAGVGFDGQVVHELDRARSGPITVATYAMPVLKALAGYRAIPLTVEVDGQVVLEDRPAIAMVGNLPEYGTGFPLLPYARGDDGVLDVCVMPCASRGEVLKLAMAAAAGDHLAQEGVVYIKGRRIRVESSEPVAVQADGEAAGFTPVRIDLLPSRIGFIVPPR